jgi:hypothetical protein
MAFLSRKIAFPLKISSSMLVGYLLATIPPVILDPILLSHVGFKEPRHYPRAWLIIPIASVLFISTLILAMRSSKRREVFAMLPFVVALLGSIPIFRPEVPHGNLVFVGSTWFLLGAITTWIHDQEMMDPGAHIPVPASTSQIDFIKEETAVWKGVALGLVTAYLAIATGLTLGFHAANRDVVTSARDIFILNQYSNILFAITSLFMFLGPIYESIKKVVESNRRLLSIQPARAESEDA